MVSLKYFFKKKNLQVTESMHTYLCTMQGRLISVVDVVITPMNPYQLIPFHILSFAVFQSRILIYAGSNIAEEQKKERYLRGRIYLVNKNININNIKNIYMNKIISHQTL